MLGFLKNTFKKKPSVDTQPDKTTTGSSSSVENQNDPGKDRIRSRVLQNVKTTQRDKRDKLFNSKRDMTSSCMSNTTSDSQINSTYLVHSESTTTNNKKNITRTQSASTTGINKVESNRRKLLEEWRKKKKEETSRAPPPVTKPVFKVHHVDNKLMSKSSISSSSSTSQLPSSSSFNFHVSCKAKKKTYIFFIISF